MFPASSIPSMSAWLETCNNIRKIDNYMMNHPLWSPREEMQTKWNPRALEYIPSSIGTPAQVPAPAPAPAQVQAAQLRERARALRDLQELQHQDPQNPQNLQDPINSRDIQLCIAQRNTGNIGNDLKFMNVSWIAGLSINDWCTQENLVPDLRAAERIQETCKEKIVETIRLQEYIGIKEGGTNIVGELSVDQRNPLERSYECHFKNALERYFLRRNQTYNKDVTVLTPAFIEEIMREYLRSASFADYENAIAYAKYRHTEFRHDFVVSGNRVRFTLFAYVLPENKPFHSCIYHKASITIKNNNFTHGKYQTCRWNVKRSA